MAKTFFFLPLWNIIILIRFPGGSLLYSKLKKQKQKQKFSPFRFHTLGGGKGQDKDGRTMKLVGDAQLHLSALLYVRTQVLR